MISPAFLVYKEFDPRKKNAKWFDLAITTFRRDWKPLIDLEEAIRNKKIILSEYSIEKISNSFDDEDFKADVRIKPLPFWQAILNTIIEGITKQPPKIEVAAIDPTAMSEKEDDINKLKSRKILENDILGPQKAVGGPPVYKMPADSFSSNIQDFDRMGLDENDPDDINFFSGTYHRLNYEIAAQDLINGILAFAKFDENYIEPLVIDILSNNVSCIDCYVDKITGQITYKYLYPEICKSIRGSKNDGSDDIAKGWEDMVSLLDFLEMVGNEFDFNRDWKKILMALNFCNSTRFTGFNYGGRPYDCCDNPAHQEETGTDGWESSLCDWSQAYTYKVYVGKIQFPTAEANLTYIQKGENIYTSALVPYDYELTKKEKVSGYQKQSKYQQQYYESYYLATTAISQWIFNFGKIYLMQTEGVNDEYAFGSMIFYRKRGRSAAALSEPYIEMGTLAFWRMMWAVYHAKPDSEVILLDELVEISKWVQNQTGNKANNPAGNNWVGIMEQIIQVQKEKAVKLRAMPRIDGQPRALPFSDNKEHNGLDPIAIAMQTCITWVQQQILTTFGMNDLRLGQQQAPREGYKLNAMETENSYTATGYVYRMFQYPMQKIAQYTLNYAQDIVRYGDSIANDWLKTFLGHQSYSSLSLLKKFSVHRFGILARDRNIDWKRQKLIAACDMALSQKEIDVNQYYVVISLDNIGKAFETLDFLKLKKERKLRKRVIQDRQIEMNMQQQLNQLKIQVENTIGQWKYKTEQLRGQNEVAAAQETNKGKITVKQIGVNADLPKTHAKGEEQRQLASHKADLEQQKPFNSD